MIIFGKALVRIIAQMKKNTPFGRALARIRAKMDKKKKKHLSKGFG